MSMSFILPGCVLLLALLAGVALDGVGVRPWPKARRHVPSFEAW
jgi:hypothetical protein